MSTTKKINYTVEKSEALLALLQERGLPIVSKANGEFDRIEAVKSLIEYDRGTGKRNDGKYFKVMLHEQEGSNNSSYVFLAANGLSLYIPRNMEVIIPESHVEVLKNAVLIKTEAVRQSDNTYRYFDKPVQRYAYTVFGPADAKEFSGNLEQPPVEETPAPAE